VEEDKVQKQEILVVQEEVVDTIVVLVEQEIILQQHLHKEQMVE
jgi:hypothetical protein